MIQLTPRQKRLAKWIGYPLLAFITFVMAIFYTFPYERLGDKLREAVAEKYEVTIASVGPSLFPGGVVFEGVILQAKGGTPEDPAPTLLFDEIHVDIGLLALLSGSVNVDVEAATGGGVVEGELRYASKSVKVALETRGLPLAGIPGIKDAVGLPMAGGLDASFALELPKMKWQDAEGHFRFGCTGCSVGDGVSKIRPKLPEDASARAKEQAAMAGDGMVVPRLDLGIAEGEIEIKKGVGVIKKFETVSPDGQLVIEGEVRFADPFKQSTMPGCMKFKLSDALKKNEETKTFGNIELALGAARDEAGFIAVQIKGTLAALRFSSKSPCVLATALGGASSSKSRVAKTPRTTPRAPLEPATSEAVRRAANKETTEDEGTQPGTSGPPLDRLTKTPGQADPIEPSSKRSEEGDDGADEVDEDNRSDKADEDKDEEDQRDQPDQQDQQDQQDQPEQNDD